MIIYFDMDGVLCNFQKRKLEYIEQNKKVDKEFWINLEEISNIKQLILKLKEKYKIGIISKLPLKEKHQKDALIGKIIWINEHYSKIFNSIILTENEKGSYVSSKDDILIDNKQLNIDNWIEHGGKGILFDGYKDTIDNLYLKIEKILYENDK